MHAKAHHQVRRRGVWHRRLFIHCFWRGDKHSTRLISSRLLKRSKTIELAKPPTQTPNFFSGGAGGWQLRDFFLKTHQTYPFVPMKVIEASSANRSELDIYSEVMNAVICGYNTLSFVHTRELLYFLAVLELQTTISSIGLQLV